MNYENYEILLSTTHIYSLIDSASRADFLESQLQHSHYPQVQPFKSCVEACHRASETLFTLVFSVEFGSRCFAYGIYMFSWYNPATWPTDCADSHLTNSLFSSYILFHSLSLSLLVVGARECLTLTESHNVTPFSHPWHGFSCQLVTIMTLATQIEDPVGWGESLYPSYLQKPQLWLKIRGPPWITCC